MNRGDRLELFVEKMVFEGAGLAKIDGFPVFVDLAAPEEKVLAEILSVNKNFAKAKVVEVLEPSKHRVKPFCSMANVCGGCSWQHIDYAEQLAQKKLIVQENIKKISGLDLEVRDVIPSPKTEKYRCKIQYPIAQTKVSKRLLAGYYKKNTHELVNIKYCPIQNDIINEIVEFIRQKTVEFGVTGYDEKKHKGALRHLVFRQSHANGEILVVFVVNDKKLRDNVKRLAETVFDKYNDVVGCLVSFNPNKTNAILGKDITTVIGQDYYTEKLNDKVYHVSAGSFFQVNPPSALNILNTVKQLIVEEVDSPDILDVYSGVGSFGIYLGDIAKSVTCVEDFPSATADAKKNVQLNGYNNFEILTGDAGVQLKNLINAKKQFDVVIVDPPRKGLEQAAVEIASKLSKNLVIYVSCNPSTLARDLKIFVQNGFEAEFVQPVDMFCHTFHIENIVRLKRV